MNRITRRQALKRAAAAGGAALLASKVGAAQEANDKQPDNAGLRSLEQEENRPDAGWSWRLTAPDPTFACCPPVAGNGLMGARLGAFVLGTDAEAPRWTGTGGPPMLFTMPRFDPMSPLAVYARFCRDGALLALPAWHMLDLRVDDVRFQPGQGSFKGESTLDLRTGEASLTGAWGGVRIAIRLLLPRTLNHGGFFELSVEGNSASRIEASVGWTAHHLPELGLAWRREGSRLLGDGMTRGKSRPLRLGAQLDLKTGVMHDAAHDAGGGDAGWSIAGQGGRLELALCATIHGGMEPGDPDLARRTDLDKLVAGRADGSLRRENEACWRDIWSRALDVTFLPAEHRQLVLAQQYYLLASSDASPWPTGPLGIAGNSWKGRQMWDNDLWIFRALLPLWPEFAEPMLAVRLRQLPEARKTAARAGLRGAMLGNGDEDGIDHGNPRSGQEIHFAAWPAFGVWDYWRATGQMEALRRYWPILRDTADFFASLCTRDADGSWHLRGIVPADEYVRERAHTVCDDSVTTNLVVRAVLRAAGDAAAVLQEPATPEWRTVGENLVVLGPDAHGIIPEYAGYAGAPIKQADVALAFYPLNLQLSPDVVRRNLAYYDQRCDPFGPLMSRQIDACVLMRLGDRAEGLRILMESFRRNVRGAFLIPTETPYNTNVGFITGCGGLLQALIYGLIGYRQPGDDLRLIPRLGAIRAGEPPRPS
jgi:hypothetical protein